ncbi:hypothetical protein SYNPS1DRAFT_7570, partial [Syncephalis pseudoplumigaleata]
QYLVIAEDFTDDDALSRRLQVRQAHLDRANTMKQQGTMLFGGALLTADEQTMNGSVIVFEANDEDEVRRWIAEDPYVVNGVWNDIDIRPF